MLAAWSKMRLSHQGLSRPSEWQHRRRAAAAYASLTAQAAAGAGRPFLTLERAARPSPEQAALISSGAFRAEVVPDLPIATTWGNLFKAAFG